MITSLYAAILGLLICKLALIVIKKRRKNKVAYADGGVLELQIARTAHSNAVDYVPITLILLFLLEQTECHYLVIHLFGIVFVAGRIIHAKNILSENMKGRVLGMQITIYSIIALSIANIIYFVMAQFT